MVKGGLLMLRAMDSPRRMICCTVYGPRFCCPLFGERTHMTGLRELCPGISLVPRLHDRPGNEASSGVCDRYVPE